MTLALLANVFSDAYGLIEDVTDELDELSSHWWFIAVIFAIAYLDSIVPIVPSETAVIIGGVAAGQGNQNIALVIAVGALGAFLGDCTAYLIGSKLRRPIARATEHRPKWAGRVAWARAQIRSRGGPLLITARFVPGGRTALTLTSGITHQPIGWFVRWIAVATVLWASYAGLLGYIFGNTFKDDHTKAFLIAFGTALSITFVIELVRHFRRSDDSDGDLTTSTTSTTVTPAGDVAADSDPDPDPDSDNAGDGATITDHAD